MDAGDYMLDVAMVSDIGFHRSQNEDNCYLDGNREERISEFRRVFTRKSAAGGQLFAVCDGMGGEANGEEASRIAVKKLDALKEELEQLGNAETPEVIARGIWEYATHANLAVRDAANLHGVKMGTTLAMLYLHRGMAFAANIGDSRIYLKRGSSMLQLSVDQTDAERKARQGLISREEIHTHAGRNLLVNFIGQPGEDAPRPCIRRGIELWRGDTWLLCSDGLTDMVTPERMRALCAWPGDAKRQAARLVRHALRAGGRDNVTVIVIRVIGRGRGQAIDTRR